MDHAGHHLLPDLRPPETARPPHILVVDDEPQTLLSLSVALGQAGFAIEEAGDGAEALAMLERAAVTMPIDLVLLDLQMPNCDGFGFLDRIERLHQRIPVVVMTGFGDRANLLRLMQRGCHDLLNKPFRPDELLAMVRAVLERPMLAIPAPCVTDALGGCCGPCPAAARRHQCRPPGRILLATRPTTDGCLVLAAEIAGHDTPLMVHADLIQEAFSTYAAIGGDPASCLHAINRDLLARRVVPNLVTAQIAVISSRLGLVHIASAGHPLPLFLRRDGGMEWMGREGDPLGVLPAISCTTTAVEVAPGDRLVLMNGGLLACSGPELLIALARDHRPHDPQTAVEAMFATIIGADDGRCPADDCLLAIIDIPAPVGDLP